MFEIDDDSETDGFNVGDYVECIDANPTWNRVIPPFKVGDILRIKEVYNYEFCYLDEVVGEWRQSRFKLKRHPNV